MHHGIFGGEARGGLTAPAHGLCHRAVARGEREVHRLPGGAGGTVQAHGGAALCGHVIAERGMCGLREAQLRLVRQGQIRQVAQIGGRCAPLPEIAIKL